MYCTKCGSKLNENGICLNCTNNNLANNTQKKTSVGKIYFKFVLCGIVVFFLVSIFQIVLRSSQNEINENLYSMLSSIKIIVPMLFIFLGIIPAVIIANKDNKS